MRGVASGAGTRGPCAGRRRARPATACRRAPISVGASESLSTKPWAPESSASHRRSWSAWAVNITTRTSGCRATIARVASRPLIPGMRASMSTTSGRRRPTSATASGPLSASPTTWRSSVWESTRRRPSRTTWWSSTTRQPVVRGAPGVPPRRPAPASTARRTRSSVRAEGRNPSPTRARRAVRSSMLTPPPAGPGGRRAPETGATARCRAEPRGAPSPLQREVQVEAEDDHLPPACFELGERRHQVDVRPRGLGRGEVDAVEGHDRALAPGGGEGLVDDDPPQPAPEGPAVQLVDPREGQDEGVLDDVVRPVAVGGEREPVRHAPGMCRWKSCSAAAGSPLLRRSTRGASSFVAAI